MDILTNFADIKNKIDFFIREKNKFSRKNYCPQNKEETQESKWLFEVLSEHFSIGNNENLKVADIGCKNWNYVKGEYDFFKKHCEKLSLKGIEIDAHRLYSNFYSRCEVAKFYIKNLEGCEFIDCDFLNLNEKFDYIIWILPFVFKRPHIKWGLPLNLFSPEKLLCHAYNSLNKGGKMLIINQGEEEFNIQKQMFENLKIRYSEIGEIKSDIHKFKRYGSLILK